MMVVLSLSVTIRRAATELAELDVLEPGAELLGDDLRARQDRDVLQHRLAALAEAGALTAQHLRTPRI